MITLYDIPSNFPTKAWSPNVWKTRFALNYKGLEHKTEWLEYPEIKPACKKLGIPPSAQRKDGTDYYSVPFIIDSSTGAKVSDSWNIAVYLEETYPAPSYKSLFPTPHSRVVLFAFNKGLWNCFPAGLVDLLLLDTTRSLNPISAEYYEKRVEEEFQFGCHVGEIAPLGSQKRKELWAKIRKSLDGLSAEYDRNGPETTFVMGDKLTYADFILGAYIMWDKIALPNEEWELLKTLNAGRWGRLHVAMGPYESIF